MSRNRSSAMSNLSNISDINEGIYEATTTDYDRGYEKGYETALYKTLGGRWKKVLEHKDKLRECIHDILDNVNSSSSNTNTRRNARKSRNMRKSRKGTRKN